MGFLMLGLLVFAVAYLCAPVFDWTKNMYSTVHGNLAENQLNLYRSMSEKPYRGLAMGLGAILIGLFASIILVLLIGWAVDTYMSDSIIKGIVLLSLFIGLVTMPVIFAIHARITVDCWFQFRGEQDSRV